MTTHTLNGRTRKVPWLPHMQTFADSIYTVPIYTVQVVLRGSCPVKGGVADSQLDLPSLTLLSIAGCGRLQLRVAYWATSVALLQVADNWPDKQL